MVRPSWEFISRVQVEPWIRRLPAEDLLAVTHRRLAEVWSQTAWATPKGARQGTCAGLRLMLASGYDHPEQLSDADLDALPPRASGLDMLDVALCELKVFDRSPKRGTTRRMARPPHTIEALVHLSVPARFEAVTVAYVTAYSQRVSSNYGTIRSKVRSLGDIEVIARERSR